jgi:Ca2+-binding RTX toxin-like protein
MADITGTSGDDNLGGTNTDDTISGLEGNDLLVGLGGDDILDGGDGEDILRGRDGNDTALGGAGNDYLQGGEGDDTLDGGDGFDRAAYSLLPTDPQVGATVDLTLQGVAQDTGHGFDTLFNIEHVSGTIYSDTLSGDAGANWLWGSVAGPGGTSGDDVLSGRGGDDLLEVSQGNHILDGGADTDTVSFFSNQDIGSAGFEGVIVSLALQGAAQDTGHGLMTLTGIENLSGSIVNDNLKGDAGANTLAGRDGHDFLGGGDGDDVLLGDGQFGIDFVIGGSGPIVQVDDGGYAGDDVLNGGNGFNILNGGAGTDTVDYTDAAGSVTVALASGFGQRNDATDTTVLGTDSLISIENATGGGFNDVLLGDNGNNTLDGGNGDDNLRGGGGDDWLIGGAHDDLLRGGQGVDTFLGGDGLDRISLFEAGATQAAYVDLEFQQVLNDGFGNVESLDSIEGVGLGTLFADTFLGSSGANFIYAGSGDVVDARGGDDDILLAGATFSLDGGDGVDSLEFSTFRFTDPDLNNIPDQEDATAGVFVSLIAGRIYDDGFGDGGTIANVENVTGTDFDDILFGDAQDNVLIGLGGFDQIRANGGNDTLDGGDGDDLLRTGSGADTFLGGNGFDRVSFYNLDATQGVVANLQTQTIANDGFGNAETMSSIEGLGSHTRFADHFTGDDQRNLFLIGGGDTLYALGGDDDIQVDDAPVRLDGGDGIDTLTQFTLTRLRDTNGDGIAEVENGYMGVAVNLATSRILNDGFSGMGRIYNVENVGGSVLDDSLTGNGLANSLWGFEGDDLIAGGGGIDTIDGGDGADILNGDGGNDVIEGGGGDDTVYGGAGADTVTAGAGADQVWGGAAADTLSGGLDNDVLHGEDGADTVNGDEGDDTLIGGIGNDTLFGGDGLDVLTGGAGKDFLAGGMGVDTFVFLDLADSTTANAGRDTITDLLAEDFIDLSAIDANTALGGDQAFVKVGAFSGVAGQLTLSLSGASTLLRVDVNGDSVADMTITLTGNHVSHSNFVY